MPRFAIDYDGWIYVDAEDSHAANALAMNILSEKHPYDEWGGDWTITDVVEVPDDEGRTHGA